MNIVHTEEFQTRDGRTVQLTYTDRLDDRLKTSCFRGIDKNLSGNFFAWVDYDELIDDIEMHNKLEREIMRLEREIRRKGTRKGTFRMEITLDECVGWASTLNINGLSEDQLASCERRELGSPRATALFLTDTSILAPTTDVVTITMNIAKMTDHSITLNVCTIYPGDDCGWLRGDMTESKGLVWLDWNHPGEPLEEDEEPDEFVGDYL